MIDAGDIVQAEHIEGGYVLLARRLWGSKLWALCRERPGYLLLAVHLILRANFEAVTLSIAGSPVEIPRGSFWTSLDTLHAETGLPIQRLRTALRRFKQIGFLTDKSTKRGRLISIVNYEVYQHAPAYGNKGANRQLTDDQQTPNKRLTGNKQLEEGEEGEDRDSSLVLPEAKPTPAELFFGKLAKLWNEIPRRYVVHLGTFDKTRRLNKKHIGKIATLLKDKDEPQWGANALAAVEKLKSGDCAWFGNNGLGDRRCEFAWLYRVDKLDGILAERYDNGTKDDTEDIYAGMEVSGGRHER